MKEKIVHFQGTTSQSSATNLGWFTDRISSMVKPRLSDKLLMSLATGNSANSALLDSINRVQGAGIATPTPNEFRIPLPLPNPIHDTNRHLNDINEQLEAVEDMAVKMAETVSAMSDTSSQFVRDFAAASGQANRAATTAAGLAALGILAVVAQFLYSAYTARQQEPQTQAAISTIVQKLEALTDLQRDKDDIARQDSERLRAAINDLAKSLRASAAPPPKTKPANLPKR